MRLSETAFSEAVNKQGTDGGIGTLSEKSLHRILKYTVDPCVENHEVSCLGSIVDVRNEGGIFEIQTGSLLPLKSKLIKLLSEYKVTVVYPIPRIKRLVWIDKDSGEATEPRRSNKRGKFSDSLPELSKIESLLFSDDLTVKLVLLDLDEYKYLDGYGESKKKRATKIERIPTALADEIDINSKEDILKILPPLPEIFTAADFNKATGLRKKRAFFSLKLLLNIGAAERIGKRGNAFLYSLLTN